MEYVPYKNGKFRKASPDLQGIPSQAVLEFLTELDSHSVDIQSLYIFRHGYQLIGANRKPYRASTPRRIYSAAKALTGLAILFAIQENLVSMDSCIVDVFPEDLPQIVTERMKKMNVGHLLTMTTGHDIDTFCSVLEGENSVRAFLEIPLEFEPGTHFLYNNGVPHILGMIVKKVSGFDYIKYLEPRFLEPLEIICTVKKTEKEELEGSRTVCTAEGFAKITLFYLQEGNWNGKQLLNRELVQEAGKRQVMSGRCSSISFVHTDQLSGYGFQVWRNSTEGFRLDGGRGQFGFVFPEKELTIICNAVEEDGGLIPSILWQTLYSNIQMRETPDKDYKKQSEELKRYLEAWSCAPKLLSQPSFLDDYYGRTYLLEKNDWGILKLSVDLENGIPKVHLEDREQVYEVSCGLNGDWVENLKFPRMPKENSRLNQIFGVENPVFMVSGGWISDFCFIFQVRITNWMDYHTFYCRFNGTQLSLSVESNMEKLSHLRKRIPMKRWKYSDAPINGVWEEK